MTAKSMIEKRFCVCPQILWITLWASWGGPTQALDFSRHLAVLPDLSATSASEQNQGLSIHQGKSEWSGARAFSGCAAA
jgi:hypothetical protein